MAASRTAHNSFVYTVLCFNFIEMRQEIIETNMHFLITATVMIHRGIAQHLVLNILASRAIIIFFS